MPDEDSVAIGKLESTITAFGTGQVQTNRKLDDLVDGLNNFKVEVTRGFGSVQNSVDLVDQRLTNHENEDDRRIGDVDKKATDAKRIAYAAGGGGPTKTQAGAAVGSAGVLGVFLDRLFHYFSSGGGS